MKYLFDFLPAIVISMYITTMNIVGFRLSLLRLLSLISLILITTVLYMRQKNENLSAIEKGFFIYIAFNTLVFWVFPGNTALLIADFPTGILYTVLFLVISVPALLINSYFTEFYARKSTPEAYHGTDIFKAINRNMTLIWAAIFAVSAFITTIPFLFNITRSVFTNLIFQIILPAALISGTGIPLNRKYPDYFKRKKGIESGPGAISTEIYSAKTIMNDQHQKEGTMSEQFKVVAINGSPHSVIGNISQMIQMIASTLYQENIIMEEIFLTEKKIEYCIGCAVCLEKGKCWRTDDYQETVNKLLDADGIILASPVYFGHVTAQMKTFIDRSLGYGHKPRSTWKPGLAISVSAGRGETETAYYLSRSLGVYGSFSIGNLTAIATNPGAFLGKELVEARAEDLAHDLARAIKEKRQYPATDEGLSFYLFMRDLVIREKSFMTDDYQHWEKTGLFSGFEAFVHQEFAPYNYNQEIKKEWLKAIIQEDRLRNKGVTDKADEEKTAKSPLHNAAIDKASIKTCFELLKIMPLGFKSDAAQNLSAIYQFEISGSEQFTAHLLISNNQCIFYEGPHMKPDIIIKSPAAIWLAISKGDMNGQAAFMSGKYTAEGNIGLLMRLKNIFT